MSGNGIRHSSLVTQPSVLLLDQFGDEGGPAGLVARAEAGAGISVEVLIEEEMVAPVGVLLEGRTVGEHRAAAVRVALEDLHQALREEVRDLGECEECTGAGGALDCEVVAVVAVKALD